MRSVGNWMDEKLGLSDPVAPIAGISVLSTVIGLTIEGIGWQFAFTFMAGFSFAATVFALIELRVRRTSQRNADELQAQMRELATRAAAEGYRQALDDVREVISGGGEGR